MKIGILSMQRIPNYGSFLQAFSLKKQMEERGHEVYFIDIIDGRKIVDSKETHASVVKKFDRYIVKRIENYFFYRKMLKIHEEDARKYLSIDKKIRNNNQFDIVIIGSDEVFNATIPSKWGFSTQLFGDILNTKSIVTYAASCGSTTFEKATRYNIVQDIRKYMQNIERISVRDKNTAEFVYMISDRKAEINVDPVFLTNYDRYIPKIKDRRSYILVYAYENRINNIEEIDAIKKIAQEENLDIISVGMQQRWCKHNIIANAFELLSYVKNAKYIVTDTFHGSVFSIKYNKQFITFIRESNTEKLRGLLEQFGLLGRAVSDITEVSSTLHTRIDWNRVNDLILYEQEKSKSYLDEICSRKIKK